MQNPPLLPHEKNWWSRNWLWVLPATLVTLGLVLFTAAALIVGGVMQILKSSDFYKQTMEGVRQSPEVAAQLGSPVKDGFFITGSINTGSSSGRANLAIPVSGPKGEGTVYAVGQQNLGEWIFTGLAVKIRGVPKPINLLDSGKEEPAEK